MSKIHPLAEIIADKAIAERYGGDGVQIRYRLPDGTLLEGMGWYGDEARLDLAEKLSKWSDNQ